LIERAYREGESQGVAVWCHDQAGPYPTRPYPGRSWQPAGDAARQPAEYVRAGTAKLLALFHPQDGHLRAKGVTECPNRVLHPWLKQELSAVLAALPEPKGVPDARGACDEWQQWQAGLTIHFTLPEQLPRLRIVLILDNLTGHKSRDFVLWLVAQGIMPLYTPLSGSWLNMSESIQRIVVRRALAGQDPHSPEDIIAWLEATARHWNCHPTPFAWGGKRAVRRARSRHRRHALGGSGAWTHRPIRRRPTILEKWIHSCQMTH
jgi:hypothetical protein